MAKHIALVTLAALVISAAPSPALAAKKLTGTPVVTTLTLTPPVLHEGRAALKVLGSNIEKYVVSADCPEQLYLKSGSRNLCEGSHKLSAKRLKKLWLNLRNPNDLTGTIEITVVGLNSNKDETAPRSISLLVTEDGD